MARVSSYASSPGANCWPWKVSSSATVDVALIAALSMLPPRRAAPADVPSGHAVVACEPPTADLRCQGSGRAPRMDASAVPRHVVLHYLAVARAARDFGLDADELDPLVLRFDPASGSAGELADAVTAT